MIARVSEIKLYRIYKLNKGGLESDVSYTKGVGIKGQMHIKTRLGPFVSQKFIPVCITALFERFIIRKIVLYCLFGDECSL